MERNKKIALLKAIEAGKISINSIQPVRFVELASYSDKPGLLFNNDGQGYTESEAEKHIESIKATSSICFLEIKTY